MPSEKGLPLEGTEGQSPSSHTSSTFCKDTQHKCLPVDDNQEWEHCYILQGRTVHLQQVLPSNLMVLHCREHRIDTEEIWVYYRVNRKWRDRLHPIDSAYLCERKEFPQVFHETSWHHDETFHNRWSHEHGGEDQRCHMENIPFLETLFQWSVSLLTGNRLYWRETIMINLTDVSYLPS